MHIITKKAVAGAALLLGLILLISSLAATLVSAEASLLPAETKEALSLPCTEKLVFSEGDAGLRASVSVFCKRLSIVTASVSSGSPEDKLELAVYTDSGQLVCRAYPDASGKVTAQLLPAYTGCYKITVLCRGGDGGEVTLHASEYSKYKSNATESLPYSEEHSKKTHRYSHASAIYSTHAKDAEGWEVSVFTLSHGAGDVLSYKLDARGDSSIRAVLYTYEGEYYRPHHSHSTESYAAGDARVLSYSEDCYLLVYSSGEFTLEAELIKCREAVSEELSLPFSGDIDLSDGKERYDAEEYSRLVEEFPFCDVENPRIKYFYARAEGPSVISLVCSRREHAYFDIVSDAHGLSPHSSYPLRSYGSYCSETRPVENCCEQFVSDSGGAVIVYSGSSLCTAVRVEASPLFSSKTAYDAEYHKNTPLPTPVIDSAFSDSALFASLGLGEHDSESIKFIGCVIECEDSTRYYYEADDLILPPEKKGECRAYALIKRICVRDGVGESSVHRLHVCTFKTTGVLFIPTIEEMIEGIENKDPGSILYLVLFSLPVLVVAAAAVLLVVIGKKRKKARKPAPSKSIPIAEKKSEGEE